MRVGREEGVAGVPRMNKKAAVASLFIAHAHNSQTSICLCACLCVRVSVCVRERGGKGYSEVQEKLLKGVLRSMSLPKSVFVSDFPEPCVWISLVVRILYIFPLLGSLFLLFILL